MAVLPKTLHERKYEATLRINEKTSIQSSKIDGFLQAQYDLAKKRKPESSEKENFTVAEKTLLKIIENATVLQKEFNKDLETVITDVNANYFLARERHSKYSNGMIVGFATNWTEKTYKKQSN